MAMALAAVACNSRPPQYVPPTDTTERSYTLGTEVRASVGAAFLSVQRTQKHHYWNAEWRYWTTEIQINRHELLYSGVDRKTLLVSYREYASQSEADLYARPAFAQDLRYDLAASDTIVFRDYRMRIIEATNEAIRVVVLSEGGESPEPGTP